jgi:hypothetical protein
MRSKSILIVLAVCIGIALGYWWMKRAKVSVPSNAPKSNVQIEDQKTIDFSSGKAVVKDSADDKAVMDKAVKEMNDATKNFTFGPTTPPPANKPADPPPKR